jgi:hypothetical protein
MKKNALIRQPAGLGDILWLQPIVLHLLDNGYEVHFPVADVYYQSIVDHIRLDRLHWWHVDRDFPFKNMYGPVGIRQTFENNSLFLYCGFDNLNIANCPIMLQKYAAFGMPICDWRKSVRITRNLEREKILIDRYGIDNRTLLINSTFGTPPHYNVKSEDMMKTGSEIWTNIAKKHGFKVLEMEYQTDVDNGFNLFDWIGAIEICAGIFSVETSLCYFADMYAPENSILYMFERKRKGIPRNYFKEVALVYRHPGWNYII